MTREEAINEIKSWDFLNEKENEAIRTLIPELRESEDERIRKRLVTLVEQFAQGAVKKPRWEINNPHTTKWTRETIDEKFEELVEQRPVEWNKEDEMYLSQAIETLEHENYSILADKLKSLCPQPKQGWSEEDERILKGIIGKIEHDQTYGVSQDEMLNFLKKL